MIRDGRDVTPGAVVRGDVCIIGAGPAGISLALRLAAASQLRIILLESGGERFDPDQQTLARGETAGLDYFPLNETRIRMLGGTSQSWGGVCAAFDRSAMDPRDWVPGGGWPFPADTLDPYVMDALATCGIDAQHQRLDRSAHDRRSSAWAGAADTVRPTLVHFSRPLRFGSEYRGRLASSDQIHVYLHSTAVGLVAGEGGSGISEVVVACLNGPTYHVRARAVVLAAGGVENARLLLASSRAHGGNINVGNEVVGRSFMEHPRIVSRFRVRAGRTKLGRLIGAGAAGTLRFLRLEIAPEVQRRERLLAWHANVQFGFAGQDSPAWPSVRRIAIATRGPWNESPYFQDSGGGRTGIRATDVRRALRHPVGGALGAVGAIAEPARLRRWLEIVGSVEQLPRRENRVELTGERDPLGVPRIRVIWGVDEAERKTHDRAMELLLGALESIEPGITASRLAGGDVWPDDIIGTWHHIGATRMSADPHDGVVDADCRVHGIDNLYIVGSSVFPVSGSTSPTLTIVQLALRLGDHLIGRLLSGAVGVNDADRTQTSTATKGSAGVAMVDLAAPPIHPVAT